MVRVVIYQGHKWVAEAHSFVVSEGASRTKVTFRREDTGETAKGWVHGSVRDFEGLPVATLVDALIAALSPKKISRDWE